MVDPNIVSRFDEIYNSTYKSVVSLITAKCRNTADISDITQETYMELYQLLNKQGADYIRNDKAVVLKIARRKIARYYSLLERMRIFVPLTSVNDNGDEVMLSDLEASDFLTEDFAINKVLIDKARQIIAEKPLDVRKVFYLFYDVDLTIPEIAKELSMTESNVKHKLYRTLKELRKLL